MFILSENDRPFAILTKLDESKMKRAIEEEFSVKEAIVPDITEPDWGEVRELYIEAKDRDEGDEVCYDLELSKIVSY